VFADRYKKSQVVFQLMNEEIIRFPLNVICTKLNSQLQDGQNDVAPAAPDTERTDLPQIMVHRSQRRSLIWYKTIFDRLPRSALNEQYGLYEWFKGPTCQQRIMLQIIEQY